MRVGVLALQGGFAAHGRVLVSLGHRTIEIRDADQLDDRLEGLILPGGESSTQRMLLERASMVAALDRVVRSGRPVLATCAGLVLAARHVVSETALGFGWIDVCVARNAWGRQVHSFRDRAIGCDRWAGRDTDMLFIRAPRIVEIDSGVEVIARLASGEVVAVRQGAVVGVSGHPELVGDTTVHELVFGRDPDTE